MKWFLSLLVLCAVGCDSGPPSSEEACAGCDDEVREQVCLEGYQHCSTTKGCDLKAYVSDEVAALCGE